MKSITNKIAYVKVPLSDGTVKEVERKYSDLLIEAINNPPREGFSVKEMRLRLDILDRCEKANGEIELKDKDQLAKVKECVEQMKFRFMSKDLLLFCETIIKL